MKEHIEQLIQTALAKLQQIEKLPAELPKDFRIERTRDRQHGDFSCNVAMVLAKPTKQLPRALAAMITEHLPISAQIEKVDIAGPGFINFHLSAQATRVVVTDILQQGIAFGRSTSGKNLRINVEFVSSNPTGPLHVGHGRQAAYGASVCNLLDAVGFKVHREYYVNDAGRQMNIITISVWLRYLELYQEPIAFPSNGYQGDYVWDIAKQLQSHYGDIFKTPAAKIFADLPPDATADGIGDKEAHTDAIILRARNLLGEPHYQTILKFVLDNIVAEMRNDLEEFGVFHDVWFSERSLTENNAITRCIEKLKAGGFTYEEQGALWFRSSDFGDEKDRVLIRSNGEATYFAPDVAYHFSKFERGFERALDVLGADHHGYVPRIRASIAALQGDPNKLDISFVQFVSLYRGKEKLPMSTRAGSFVTLRELRKEVGNDAARFFYVMRKNEQHLDFDLELAKSHSNDNPVFYIQYAHARICSVMRQLSEKGWQWEQAQGLTALEHLQTDHEIALLNDLARYPEMVEVAASGYDPHVIAHYLCELANSFHTYYNAQQFLVEEQNLRNARLCLIAATRQVIKNGLTLLGINAPESM